MGTESPEVRVQATPKAGGLGGQKQSAQTETGREGGREGARSCWPEKRAQLKGSLGARLS